MSLRDNKFYLLERAAFDKFLVTLKTGGYQTIGPVVKDNAIVFDSVNVAADFPLGWSDHQDGGSYRLVKNDVPALFGHVVGMQSLKKYLYPPVRTILEVEKNGKRFKAGSPESEYPRLAFIGVRPCDLAALATHEKVLANGPYADPDFTKRRENSLIVAVNCTRPGGTCFCADMGTGPRAEGGYDILMTEMCTSSSHTFLIQGGSDRGEEIIKSLSCREASDAEIKTVERALEQAAGKMGRHLGQDGLKDELYKNFDHPRWEAVAERCLNCANCTMVCPTCFCMNVEDTTDLAGNKAFRSRRWDSCFTVDFSYIHGGSIRSSGMSRYRQWLLHKLSYWHEQFGLAGCVGCGRCITWCPVGIDITEEAAVISGRKK